MYYLLGEAIATDILVTGFVVQGHIFLWGKIHTPVNMKCLMKFSSKMSIFIRLLCLGSIILL